MSRIFEPFFTTKPNGMGMGLSVSHTIVEAHGGKLCAENAPQGGAVFRVALPLADEVSEPRG
jgi:signal transduction histidine kinase